MSIPLLDLSRQYQTLKSEIDAAVQAVLQSGQYILGPWVREFEGEMEQYLGVQHAIGVASGSDALLLSLMALDLKPGDQVLVPAFTFFATASAVSRLGGIPRFVDVDPQFYHLDLAQTAEILASEPRIKALIPVHLFGQPCPLGPLMALKEEYGVGIIEDACQGIGANLTGESGAVKVGTQGDTGCFSFFPTKNLGGAGDGGLVVTQNVELAAKIKQLRVHGAQPKYVHHKLGINSRLDSLQAAILQVKLRYLPDWTQKRRQIAAAYEQAFHHQGLTQKVTLPQRTSEHVFHQYVIQVAASDRDALANFLERQGIGTAVYYPVPLHLQPCYRDLAYQKGDLPVAEALSQRVLALPIDPGLDQEAIEEVVGQIQRFFAEKKGQEI